MVRDRPRGLVVRLVRRIGRVGRVSRDVHVGGREDHEVRGGDVLDLGGGPLGLVGPMAGLRRVRSRVVLVVWELVMVDRPAHAPRMEVVEDARREDLVVEAGVRPDGLVVDGEVDHEVLQAVEDARGEELVEVVLDDHGEALGPMVLRCPSRRSR